MWPLHPIFHAALDKWPEALADTVLLGICEFTCGPQAASHHPWSRSCIPAFGYRTRVDHFHSGTPLLVVHALSCALPNCDPGWKSVVLNRSRERQICLVCMRGVKLMSLPERPPFACGAPEPLRHASGCFGLHLQAPNRPSRCRRFCSGQSLRNPSGSTACIGDVPTDSIQSRYFPSKSTAFTKPLCLLWEQRVGGSNPSAPTIYQLIGTEPLSPYSV